MHGQSADPSTSHRQAPHAQVYTAISSSLANPGVDPGKALSEAEALIQGLTGDPASKGLAAKAVTAASGASKLTSRLGIPFGPSRPRPNMTGEDAGAATTVPGRCAHPSKDPAA